MPGCVVLSREKNISIGDKDVYTEALIPIHSTLIDCLLCARHEPKRNVSFMRFFFLVYTAVSFPGGSRSERVKSKSLQTWHRHGRPRPARAASPLLLTSLNGLQQHLCGFCPLGYCSSCPPTPAAALNVLPGLLAGQLASPLVKALLDLRPVYIYLSFRLLHGIAIICMCLSVCPNGQNILEGRECVLPLQCWALPGT